jgi:hypothetical protein
MRLREAIQVSLRRLGLSTNGAVHLIKHYVHTDHVALAESVGLTLIEDRDAAVGPSIHPFYVRGIGLKAYKRDEGLNLVAGYLFQKINPAIDNTVTIG